jgi:thymidylate synthase
MSVYITGETSADVWIKVMEHLLSVNGRCFHLVASIARPTDEFKEITRIVDKLADETGTKSTMENANAIWPRMMAPPGQDLTKTMKRIREFAIPLIKDANPKHADSYLERLVAWRSRDGGQAVPQLENAIVRMWSEKENTAPKSSAYEIPIVSPGLDAGYMGFPCLSHLSFKLDAVARKIHLTALYRNHHFITHGYGNYIGLGRLLGFVATQVEYGVGELLAISTHADAELQLGRGRIKTRLVEAARALNEISALSQTPKSQVNATA